ncbi:hypothetical protein J6590_102064, partial [Homalodisca vitripennis]
MSEQRFELETFRHTVRARRDDLLRPERLWPVKELQAFTTRIHGEAKLSYASYYLC